MPKISVIMPSLNVANYIEEALTSVVNQTLSDIEIICVDGGSTDGTLEIINSFANKDSRICLFKTEIKSYGYQMNLGISKAKGEYIAILETDDYIDTRMYEELYPKAKENNLDILWAEYDLFYLDANGEKVFGDYPAWPQNPENYNRLFSSKDIAQLKYDASSFWRGLFRRTFLKENGIIFNETPGAAFQDISFTYRLLMSVKRLMFIPESYYRYRIDSSSSSTNSLGCLAFSFHENSLFLHNQELVPGYEKLFYRRMATSFLYCLNLLIDRPYPPKIDFAWLQKNINIYAWFLDTLRKAENDGFFTEESGDDFWRNFQHLPETLFDYAVSRLNGKVWKFTRQFLDKRIILCGSDLDFLAKLAKGLFLDIEAICIEEEKKTDCDFPVLSCTDAEIKKQDRLFLIADKKTPATIKNKLAKLGIAEKQIVIFPESLLNPALSIILPVSNSIACLDDILQDLERQKFRDVEIILVHALGADFIPEILLQKYTHADRSIKIVKTSKNNYGSLLNAGLNQATGEYVAFLLQGSKIDENMYQKLYHTAKINDLDAVFCNYSNIREINGEKQQTWLTVMPAIGDKYEKLLTDDELKAPTPPFDSGAGIFRRKLLLESVTTFQFIHDKFSGDIALSQQLGMKMHRVMRLPHFYYTHSEHPVGQSLQKSRMMDVYQVHKSIIAKKGIKSGFEKRFYTMLADSTFGARSSCLTQINENLSQINEKWIIENEDAWQFLQKQIMANITYLDEHLAATLRTLPATLREYIITFYPPEIRVAIKANPDCRIILFGAGRRGKRLYATLPRNFIPIDSFADNDEAINGSSVLGLSVLPVEKCVMKYPGHFYLITVKAHEFEIRKQLLTLGIAGKKIFTM